MTSCQFNRQKGEKLFTERFVPPLSNFTGNLLRKARMVYFGQGSAGIGRGDKSRLREIREGFRKI
jgi:hypothetical protein